MQTAEELAEKIRSLGNENRRVVAAIDGPSCAGKTTLAHRTAEILRCPVLSLDDFFLRPEQRTQSRYEEPGGNVDYERFLSEVIPVMKEKAAFAYGKFSCSEMSVRTKTTVPQGNFLIVEGSYSLHPLFCDYYDLRVWMEVSSETQTERVRKRNPDRYKAFLERWFPLEKKYRDVLCPREKADLIVNESGELILQDTR